MLAVLHMAQYFPAVFVGAALPYLFRKEGLALNLFWLLAIPGYTRFFKFLLALLVDRYSFSRLGRRKSWIIPCTIIGVLSYLSLSFFPPDVQWIYVIVGILTFKSLVMAAQDIAVDAYAAESMTDEERPLGTSLINCLAGIAGAIGFAAVAIVEAFNWATAMVVASLLLIIAALPAVVRDEPPPPRAALIKKKDLGFSVLKSMRWSLFRRDSWYILPFMFFFGFGGSLGPTMIPAFWADQSLTTTQYAVLSASAAVAGGVLAIFTVPWLANRIGLRKNAMVGLIVVPIQAAMYIIFSLMEDLPAMPTILLSYILIAWAVAHYGHSVSISRFRWVSKAQAGTDYAVQSSVWNLGVVSAATVSGFIATWTGAESGNWTGFFVISASVIVCAGLFYIFCFDKIEKWVVEREREEMVESA